MSSWITSVFKSLTETDDDHDNPTSSTSSKPDSSPSAGTKNDLSAVIRGVASFLAPVQSPSVSRPSSERIEGIKNDLSEIQGSLISGLSLISSKLTSNILQFQSQLDDGHENDEAEEEEGEDVAVGINDEILDFIRKICRRPELWTDFPLILPDDFDLSDYQRDHAAEVEYLLPEFATFRQQIGNLISDGKFWHIYFILLHPRLNEEDLKLLSTPQVTESRELLLKQLHGGAVVVQGNPTSSGTDDSPSSQSVNPTTLINSKEAESEKAEVSFSDLEDGSEAPPQKTSGSKIDSNDARSGEEDVSFSDLEDDSEEPLSQKTSGAKIPQRNNVQKAKESGFGERESEGEESSDWLTVDNTDL